MYAQPLPTAFSQRSSGKRPATSVFREQNTHTENLVYQTLQMCCGHYHALALVTYICTQVMIASFQVSDKAALEKQIHSGVSTLGPKNH